MNIPKFNNASEMIVCLNMQYFDELLRKYVVSTSNSSSNSLIIFIVQVQLYIIACVVFVCPLQSSSSVSPGFPGSQSSVPVSS